MTALAIQGGLASRSAPPLDLPARFLITALVAFAALGALMPWETTLLLGSFYDAWLIVVVHAHTLGIVAMAIMGASYQLLPVVLQVPLASVRLARLTWWLLAASALLGLGQLPAALGAAALLLGLLLFAAQLVRLYRLRRRKAIDVHMPFALAAACGVLAAALVLLGVVRGAGPTDPLWRAAGWLAIAGWAEAAIQGFLYKIGTFLTWLHRYAPLAGRRRVPGLEALYGRRTAFAGGACWCAALILEVGAILSANPWPARLAAAAGVAGIAALLSNAARVGAHWRRDEVRPVARRAPRDLHARTGGAR